MAYRALRRQHYQRRLVTGEGSCLAGNLKRANKRKVSATPSSHRSKHPSDILVLSYLPAQPKFWLDRLYIDLAAPSGREAVGLNCTVGNALHRAPAFSGGGPGTRK